eukprot:CAMPEP_0196598434 /NCGR_PEP_ID=MMETSP1081-20130531/94318_1 /TAXON_ID=36882 /ORGANISM="Pyramimonas amylifera, Strain CCMP720" /LENGTH=636 /DNA_ID=CAMNT_0041924129 /DNA_START=383 /DNA_END=2290 /DNA_ORIENTATION=-
MSKRFISQDVRRSVRARGGEGEVASKLAQLRELMSKEDVDALIIPTDDPHQSEYVAAYYARREFISGFTGTAGTVVVTRDQAFLWTDGRYFLQAEQQLCEGWTLMRAGLPNTPDFPDFLASSLGAGACVGVDPNTLSAQAAEALIDTLEATSVKLKSLNNNLIDLVWGDARPPPPSAPLRAHPLHHAGVSAPQKLGALRAEMAGRGCAALVVSTLDQVAWLFNIRGGDIEFNPVPLCYALVEADRATLYVDDEKVNADVARYLADAGVAVRPYDLKAVQSDMTQGLARAEEGMGVWVGADVSSLAVLQACHNATKEVNKNEKAKSKARSKKTKKGSSTAASQTRFVERVVLTDSTPLADFKAVKNPAELQGMAEAHFRDGAAMASFFNWIERAVVAGEPVTEFGIGEKLIELRGAQEGFSEESFSTIAGSGPNGAVIHYRAEQETCRAVTDKELVLLDSGGQYDCGTTDTTRTFHLGSPSDHQRRCYTRVLQGNIAITTATFPAGTPGFLLDPLARLALWSEGLDYRHGTGHGVGACLNVHEGPHSISPRYNNMTPLRSGMIVSNEPGYYEDGAFGIRIEHLLVVEEKKTPNRFGGVDYLGFRPLTHIPIQSKMMMPELLSPAEVAWIDSYHAQVW